MHRNGVGGIVDFSIRSVPATSALPAGHGFSDAAVAVLHIKGNLPATRLVEGPLAPGKYYDQGSQSHGYPIAWSCVEHWTFMADVLALLSAGSEMEISSAMMPVTPSTHRNGFVWMKSRV
jgi:hypothetical protein